ncbi:MAG: hypothetical protein Q8807_03095 ['Waltheria sp.' little leaf phytoplasma]|nr:hypothetical protein ['Waltheria sp.' little leaf phytoplasma]
MMTVELGKGNNINIATDDHHQVSANTLAASKPEGPEMMRGEMDEEERLALQMIEELLNRNCSSLGVQEGEANLFL